MLCTYKSKRCSTQICCKQCIQVMFDGIMTKWPVKTHRTAQNTEQQYETDIQITFFGYLTTYYTTCCAFLKALSSRCSNCKK